jgi:hypothetical protein
MVDDNTLQKHARKAIQAGDLPSRLPDKVWAGSGTTSRCAVCSEPIVDGVEFEMVFTDEWQAVQKSCCVHRGCLEAFERAVGGLPGPSDINGHRNGQRRPMTGTAEPPE